MMQIAYSAEGIEYSRNCLGCIYHKGGTVCAKNKELIIGHQTKIPLAHGRICTEYQFQPTKAAELITTLLKVSERMNTHPAPERYPLQRSVFLLIKDKKIKFTKTGINWKAETL